MTDIATIHRSTPHRVSPRGRAGAAADRPAATLLAGSGLALALYPALRPWGDKSGDAMAAAEAFADPRWLVAHALGMAGFILLAAGLRHLARRRPGERRLRQAETRAWIAAAGLGPYFGAETFALHALGEQVVSSGDVAAVAVADSFRYGTIAMAFFGAGLVALALAGGQLAMWLWPRGMVARTGAVLVGAGLVIYLPQFFLPPSGRVVHGLLLGSGLLLVAAVLSTRSASSGRRDAAPARGTATPPAEQGSSRLR